MKSKTPEIQADWDNYQSDYPKEFQMLKWFVNAIDCLSQLFGWGEITITDFLRRDKKYIKSYHYISYGLAVDVRTKDKPKEFFWLIVAIGKLMESINPKIRTQPHWELVNKEQEHIHIEMRLW